MKKGIQTAAKNQKVEAELKRGENKSQKAEVELKKKGKKQANEEIRLG